MREARNRFANLVKEAFAKAGQDPIAFASEFKTAERREAFHALLDGDETPFAHHIDAVLVRPGRRTHAGGLYTGEGVVL